MERLAHFVRSQEAGLWNAASEPGHGLADWRLIADQRSAGVRSQRRATPANPPERPERTYPGIYRSRVVRPGAIHGPLVGTACLETEALPLHRQIVEFSRRASAAGAQTIRIVPLFLLAGVHVTADLPAEVELARQALPDLALELSPHLGSHPGLKSLLRAKKPKMAPETLILLAHGSRRSSGNEPVRALARALGGTAAFWAVPPNLETQVIELMQAGVQRLTILPYFLFAGSITDAITHRTEDLAERFPSMGFHLLPPLGPSADLARLVVDLALDRVPAKAQQPPIPMARVAFRHAIQSSSLVS